MAGTNSGVRLIRLTDRVRVEVNGELLTEYHFSTNAPQPCCFPLLGPGGAAMTRSFPMASPPGEEHDHTHHRSFWFAHGVVNGHDFWTDRTNSGRIVHAGFDEVKSGEVGVLRSRDNWIAANGETICTDERTLRFFAKLPGSNVDAGARVFDFEITLHGPKGGITLGDTKEGTMAIRVAETMRVHKQTPKGRPPEPGEGHIVLSNGARDGAAWGKRADWCDYSGPVNGKTAGIALLDHPLNPRHPTWWMVREYGLLAANPFGQHEYEKTADAHAGDLKIPAGGSVTFRYRVVLHEGDEKRGKVAESYSAFANDLPKL